MQRRVGGWLVVFVLLHATYYRLLRGRCTRLTSSYKDSKVREKGRKINPAKNRYLPFLENQRGERKADAGAVVGI